MRPGSPEGFCKISCSRRAPSVKFAATWANIVKNFCSRGINRMQPVAPEILKNHENVLLSHARSGASNLLVRSQSMLWVAANMHFALRNRERRRRGIGKPGTAVPGSHAAMYESRRDGMLKSHRGFESPEASPNP